MKKRNEILIESQQKKKMCAMDQKDGFRERKKKKPYKTKMQKGRSLVKRKALPKCI